MKFKPGNFVTEGTTDKVGVTLAIADAAEANPLVKVRWICDLTVEWVRSEYLYQLDCECGAATEGKWADKHTAGCASLRDSS